MSCRLSPTSFLGGAHGPWRVTAMTPVVGPALPAVSAVTVGTELQAGGDPGFLLRGVASHLRYTTRSEREQLVSKQEDLGRPGASHAALIPLRKSPAWWALAQDERRQIMVDAARHFTIGLRYLPAIARKLYHSRDLGEEFDFITWFEFAPNDAVAFDELVAALRETEEWRYVDREVDIRLLRSPSAGHQPSGRRA